LVPGVTGTDVAFVYPPPPPPAPALEPDKELEPPPAPPPPQDSTVIEVTPAGHVQVPDAVKDCVVVWPKRFVLETKKENRNKQIKNAMGLFELYAFGKPDFASIVILGYMELV
jgi:hypothetical protein